MFGDYIVVLAQVGIIFSPEVEESSFDEEWFLVRILELVPIDTRNIDGYHHSFQHADQSEDQVAKRVYYLTIRRRRQVSRKGRFIQLVC